MLFNVIKSDQLWYILVGFNLHVIVWFFVVYGIYIQAYPSLSYDSVNAYTLTVACTDSKDTVTGFFHVYITRNNAPVFTNLQGNLPPYNGSNLTYLTTTLVGRSRYCPISTILGILFEIVKTLMFIQNIKNKIVCILVVIICQQC